MMIDSISVVVPTYRRPEVLKRCLNALLRQSTDPLEVLVCRRSTDVETGEALNCLANPKRALVREIVIGPNDNFERALNAGIQASCGGLVALTDDDAEAPADWVARLGERFDNPEIAGVGGKDILPDEQRGDAEVVGRVGWFGRIVGGHHLGSGVARECDVLKGVNCCFRGNLVRAIGVDKRLRGPGNVVHTELSICLPMRKLGRKLIYDPALVVHHYPAVRQDGDNTGRGSFNFGGQRDAIHNETVALLDYLPLSGKFALAVWCVAVGTRAAPGAAQVLRLAVAGMPLGSAILLCCASLQGRLLGLWTWLTYKRPSAAAPHARPQRDVKSQVGAGAVG